MSIASWGKRPPELPDQPPAPANHLAKAGVQPIRGLDKDIDDDIPF